MARPIEPGERTTRHAWRAAWNHGSATRAVANVPTLAFVAAAMGWLPLELAVPLSLGICMSRLRVLGARAGWVIDGRIGPVILGGSFAGGIGVTLSRLQLPTH